jgi:signal peptidase I
MLVGAAVAVLAAAAGVVVWLRRRFVLITIRGISMEPTFRAGDRVLVRRTPLTAIRPGAVVVVEQPIMSLPPKGEAWERSATRTDLDREWMIKRAAAVPGTPVPEALVASLGEAPGATVPPGHLAVLGDNADASFDSRTCGYITERHVLGVAVRSVGRVAG